MENGDAAEGAAGQRSERPVSGAARSVRGYEASSGEALCDRWLENPYYQLFCGEEFFAHRLPFGRSSLTRWRQRMGRCFLAYAAGDAASAVLATAGCNFKRLPASLALLYAFIPSAAETACRSDQRPIVA